MLSQWPLTLRVILISILLGGSSGIVTAAMTGNYLTDYSALLQELSGPLRLADERPHTLPGSFEDAVAMVREVALPSSAHVFLFAGVSGTYNPTDAAAGAAVVTSDGWLMTYTPLSSAQLAQSRVVLGNNAYPVAAVVEDAQTGVTFLKIDASNLPVTAFGDAYDLEQGDPVFVVSGGQWLTQASFVGFAPTEGTVAKAAEAPNRLLLLSGGNTGLLSGSLVVNGAGEMVGILDAAGASGQPRAMPLNAVLPAVRSLLREGTVSRPYVGLTIIDLSRTVGLPESQTRGFDHGALVVSVEPGSPAAEAALLEGDIVTEIDGKSVSGSRSLDEFLFEYRPDDVAVLALDRAAEKVTLSVTVGEK